MKVILREDVQGVGNIGDILEVAPGYARNFLFPRNKAVEEAVWVALAFTSAMAVTKPILSNGNANRPMREARGTAASWSGLPGTR